MATPPVETMSAHEAAALALNACEAETIEILVELETFADEFDDEPAPIALAAACLAFAARVLWETAPDDLPVAARRAFLVALVEVSAAHEVIGVRR